MSLRQPSARNSSTSSSSPNPSSCRLWDEFYLRILLGRGWVWRDPTGCAEAGSPRGYHWDSPGPGRLWEQGLPGADRDPSLGNPFQAETAAVPLLIQECVSPFLAIPDIPWEGGSKVLCFPTMKSCCQCWFLWVTTASSHLPGLSQNHQPGVSQMTSRMEAGCSVPHQCPVTWRGDAWTMPEPAIGLWRPWETSTLPLRETMCDLVSPPPSWAVTG